MTGDAFPDAWDLATLRISGPLQRVAVCYLLTALGHIWVKPRAPSSADPAYDDHAEYRLIGSAGGNRGHFRIYRKHLWQCLVVLVLLGVYLLITFLTSVPGCTTGSLTPECSAAREWDRRILGESHMLSSPSFHRLSACSSCSPASCPRVDAPEWCSAAFEPDGTLSTLAAVVSTFIGLLFGHILADETRHATRVRQWLSVVLVTGVLGIVSHFLIMPLNASLWSLAYLLVTSSISSLLFIVAYVLIEMRSWKRATHAIICMGQGEVVVRGMRERGEAHGHPFASVPLTSHRHSFLSSLPQA